MTFTCLVPSTDYMWHYNCPTMEWVLCKREYQLTYLMWVWIPIYSFTDEFLYNITVDIVRLELECLFPKGVYKWVM